MFIPKSIVKSLVNHVADEPTRYALTAARFERDGDTGRAMACDGRRLIVCEWPEKAIHENHVVVDGIDSEPVESFGTLIAPKDLDATIKVKPVRKAIADKCNSIAIQEVGANGTVKVGVTNGESSTTSTVRTDDGTFPDWKQVIPDMSGENVKHISFNPHYMIDACKAMIDGGFIATDKDGAELGITMRIIGANRPIVFEGKSDVGQCKIVLMPTNAGENGIRTTIGVTPVAEPVAETVGA